MFAESSKGFIFQKFAVKFYLGLSLHIFQYGSSLCLENVCDSWCMHQTGFSSAAFVSQSKSTELCSSVAVVRPQTKFTEVSSSAAIVPHSKSTELCSSAAVVSQSKSTELCISAAVVPQSKSTEM